MRRSHGDGHGASRRPGVLRRLTGRAEPLPRSDSERISALAAENDVPVEEILRDVADFRLALETDMIIAAAAIDAESPELLSDVLDGEREELASFHGRVLDRLADAAATDELAARRARKAPRRAPRAVATAAAFVALLGAGRAALNTPESPSIQQASNSAALATAQDQYADFSSAINSESPTAVQDAAEQLHETLQDLITQHAADPEVAQRTAQLLQAEISLLQAQDSSGKNSLVLAQARNLVRMLRGAAPPQVQASVAPLLDAVAPRSTPKPAKPKASASPTATPKATPKATPSATPSQTPSSTSSASSADDDDDTPITTP